MCQKVFWSESGEKYLIGFNPRLWLDHSRTFKELSISHSCCVFRLTVLLEGEPSAQSEVLNALNWVFIKAISMFWCIDLFFYSDESLSPCCWKTAPQHELLPAHFTFEMLLCRWWAELVSFKHDAWNWGSSDQIKQRLQAKTALNKYMCGFWCERQQEMHFFTGGSVIMDYGLKLKIS